MSSNLPIFDINSLNRMSLIANFRAVGNRLVQFWYQPSVDTCFVLVDNEYIGYFKGDNYFRYPNHNEIAFIGRPEMKLCSFEVEYVPQYVSVVTEYLINRSD